MIDTHIPRTTQFDLLILLGIKLVMAKVLMASVINRAFQEQWGR